MNKPLTRRAREYFEVLDSLREEGYVTHEELQLLDAKKQAETPRMTARLIEDALLEKGFSKGSPNEQKRYRLFWMQERGIVAELGNPQMQIQSIQDDPIVGAAIAIRKQLQNDADKIITEVREKAEGRVAEINTKYSELQSQFSILQERCSAITKESEERKNKLEKIEANLLKTLEDKVHAESTLQAKEKAFLKEKTDLENEITTQKKKHDDLVTANEKYVGTLTAKYKEDVSTVKESAEKQRHQHVVEIDSLKIDKKKLEDELGKAKQSISQITHANSELTQLSKRLEKEVDHLRTENKTVNSERRNIENLLAETKGELKQLQSLFDNQKTDYQTMQEQLLNYKEKVGRLEEQLQQARSELDSVKNAQNKRDKQDKQKNE